MKQQGSSMHSEMPVDKRRERYAPFLLWLVWLVWIPFMAPVLLALFRSRPSLPGYIIPLTGVTIFFVLYLFSSRRYAYQLAMTTVGTVDRSAWLTIALLTLLSVALTLTSGKDWLILFYFTSGYSGGRLPAKLALYTISTLLIIAIIAGILINVSWLGIMQAVGYVGAIGILIIGIMRSIMSSLELHAAREEIAYLAVINERLRIARDLHDLLGHSLSLIALKSELAGRLITIAPERAVSEVGDIEKVARTTLQEVREAVSSYRQPTLASELQGVQELLSVTGIGYHYDGDVHSLDALTATVEVLLAWVVREGVTNIVRHSHAQQCTIRVTRNKQEICVEIIDDGMLIPAIPSMSTERVGHGGNGLRGLTERVSTLGGRLEAGAQREGGYRLAVWVPLTHK
ncbi:two-component sensor histidine kinase [Ktedonobacteria bacterium brp13]|nr:two-component sensor histidine kinase [Ktedonobacteria bacterium brp13]